VLQLQLQLQPEQLVVGAKHRTAQVLGHAGADPLVAAAAQGGGRAGWSAMRR
jgi:hypothetical protein